MFLNTLNNNLLELIDISSIEFDPKMYGLEASQVKMHMHTIDENNNIYKGVDSFLEIWKRLPYYNLLAPIAKNKYINPPMIIAYNIFARYIRPRLPKRKCPDNTCQLVTSKYKY